MIDGQVMIIDEFTGRILEGRRWSEGLHQAVEAKEGVAISEENQTLATITLQNYFRLYDKLSGMTGTALTEATEFMKIYEMPVVEIPTNGPMVRDDHNDLIYKTKEGKWKAVVNEIEERHEARPADPGRHDLGRDVGDALRRAQARGIEHVVLNAKPEHAEREGETIAQAGRMGAVTIATNMAGRGVDIKLGGSPEEHGQDRARKLGLKPERRKLDEELTARPTARAAAARTRASEVLELGGLFICGTERHESRRIDNQLRGRSGRQGDPGESRFFLSAEDDLIRLFAGDRIYKILDRLGPVDEEGEEYPLEAKMLTPHRRERAEEGRGAELPDPKAGARVRRRDERAAPRGLQVPPRDPRGPRHVGRDQDELAGVIERLVEQYTPGEVYEDWDLGELQVQLEQLWPLGVDAGRARPARRRSRGARGAADRGRASRLRPPRGGVRRRADALSRAPDPASDHRQPLARAPLRDGLPARGNPPPRVCPDRSPGRLQERGLHDVHGADVRDLGGVRAADLPRRGQGRPRPGAGAVRSPPSRSRARSSTRAARRRQPSALAGRRRRGAARRRRPRPAPAARSPSPAAASPRPGRPRRPGVKSEQEKIGRNDPCWCGSGKKYKKCHGA